MDNYIYNYWDLKLEAVRSSLEGNNFEAHLARDREQARELVLKSIIPAVNPGLISWGGSGTFKETGLYQDLSTNSDIRIIDTYKKEKTREEVIETRRQALLTDLFFTGSNAVTEGGSLVNLDMIGNRVGAITFGPKHVVVLVGRNKIVADVESAVARIKDYAAPANAMRLDKKTPCAKTGQCEECNTPDRTCNVWTITERSFPPGRIKVVLINEDLGL